MLKKIKILLILTCMLLLLTFFCALSAVEKIAFINLSQAGEQNSLEKLHENYHRKTIEIAGFLHCSSVGQWTLDGQSSMRSCCVTAQSKPYLQIFLNKQFDGKEHNKKVVLTGVLEVTPEYDDYGNIIKLFQMSVQTQ